MCIKKHENNLFPFKKFDYHVHLNYELDMR